MNESCNMSNTTQTPS